MASDQKFRTGDVVYHRELREKWVVAYVEVDGRHLAPCGWSYALVPVGAFDLAERATDEQSEALIQEIAAMSSPGAEDDPRRRWARRKLRDRAAMAKTDPAPPEAEVDAIAGESLVWREGVEDVIKR